MGNGFPACIELGNWGSSRTGSGGGGRGVGAVVGAAGVSDLSGGVGVTMRFLATCSTLAAPRGGFFRFVPPVIVAGYRMPRRCRDASCEVA